MASWHPQPESEPRLSGRQRDREGDASLGQRQAGQLGSDQVGRVVLPSPPDEPEGLPVLPTGSIEKDIAMLAAQLMLLTDSVEELREEIEITREIIRDELALSRDHISSQVRRKRRHRRLAARGER